MKAERKRGTQPPTTEHTKSGEDWYGRDISGQTHEKIAFIDPGFVEVTNTGAVFNECTFRRAKFNASVHTDAAFVNCTFVGCTFFDVTFTGCKFVGSMFDRCSFDLMKVDGGNWSWGRHARRRSAYGIVQRCADARG